MKYLAILMLLVSCSKPCVKNEVKKEPQKKIEVPVVGECYVSDRKYTSAGPFYKVREMGSVLALVEFRKTLQSKPDAVFIYTLNNISKYFTKIDCLGDLKK